MQLYFGLIGVALGFASVSGAALSWDGSYVLFKILDLQSPFLPHNRLVNVPFHWMVLLVSRFTTDLEILQTVFGLVYAAIPFGALAISWWVVRDLAQPLFIWAALGIGLGTLPGQLCFICEALLAIWLFWPIILAILTKIHKPQSPIIVLLLIASYFTHPVVLVLFVFGASLAFVIGFRSRDERCWMWMWAFGLSAMAALKSWTFWAFPSQYELSQLSIDVMKFHFEGSVVGLPLVSLISAWIAASMIFASRLFRGVSAVKLIPVMRVVEFISLATAGGLLVIWAREPHLWMYAISFRVWALFSSLPFMLLAMFEALIWPRKFLVNGQDDSKHRIKTVQIIGVIFCLVIVVQSASWFNLTTILRETIAQSTNNCLSVSSLSWLGRTPLNNWTTPSYSVLLQGKTPEKLVLNGDDCAEASFSEAIRIAPWDLRSRTGGWFDLQLSGLSPDQKQ